MDTEKPNADGPYATLIVHMPLSLEGSWLRIAKYYETGLTGDNDEQLKLKHKIIHIPFGSGVILPVTQLHAGHYGTENNIRYHAILSKKAWKGANLWQHENYLVKKYKKLQLNTAENLKWLVTWVRMQLKRNVRRLLILTSLDLQKDMQAS